MIFDRKRTRQVNVGGVSVGGGARVSVQTMANVDPHDAKALLEQAQACRALGCDITRMTVPDVAAAKVLGEVRRQIDLPIVADIHFDYRCALAAIEAGADALRLNPGNIGGADKLKTVAEAAKKARLPIRIGVNLGSLEKGLTRDVDGLVASALGNLKLLEDVGFRDVVISAKASNVADTIAVYRRLAEKTDTPLHVGVTEAGTFLPGTVRSSVAMGVLLSDGIGDTIRVSLTDKPESEVRVGVEILRSLGLREAGPSVTSCPTCGRTKVDLFRIAREVENSLEALDLRLKASARGAFPHVAVMGCAVNGPGEAKGADVAICGGRGEFLLYVRGECVKKIPEDRAVAAVVECVENLISKEG